jgi:hypothetical protein
MYLDKIRAWGATKQYRAADIEYIDAMVFEAEQTGRPLDEITLRGRPVDLKRLSRHKYRRSKKLQTQGNKKTMKLVPKASRNNTTTTATVIDKYKSLDAEEMIAPEQDSDSSLVLTPSPSSSDSSPQSVIPSHGFGTATSLPSPSLSSGPDAIILDNILLQLRGFLQTVTGMSSGVSQQKLSPAVLNPHKDGSISTDCSSAASIKPTLFDNIGMAIYYLKSGSRHLAFPLLHKTCDAALKAMPLADQTFLVELLATLSPANTVHFREVRKQLLEYLSTLCIKAYGRDHAVTFVCRNLLLDGAEEVELSSRALSYMLDAMHSSHNFKPDDRCMVQFALISHSRRAQDLHTAETLCRNAIEYCKNAFGPHSEQTCKAIMELVYVYTYQGRYDDGIDLVSELLRLKKARLGPEFPDRRASFAMENMSELYYYKGNVDGAIAWLRQALRSAWTICGGTDTTIHVRDKLEMLYLARGDLEAAQALRKRYPENMDALVEVGTDGSRN